MNASEPTPNEPGLTMADIAAYKQAQVAKAASELAALLKRHNVKLVAQPDLTPDGRITALIRMVYDEEN